MDDGLYCYQTTLPTYGIITIRRYNNMNNVTMNSGCVECDEMKKLEGTDWFPGLFSKLVSLATLAVLTTTANVFLMYIACRTKSLVSNTKIFFVSLCLAHLIGSSIVIPFWIITRLYPELAKQSRVFCQAASFFWTLMILTSFYSLSTLSLDRFFIISNPMRYPFKATTRRKLGVVTLLWLFCIFFASAPILGWGEYKFKADAIPICGLNMKYSLSFTIFLIVVGFGLPLVVDIFCCARIISIARRQSRCISARKGSDGSMSSSSSRSSTLSSVSSTTNMFQPTPKLSKLKQKLNSLRLVFAGTGSFFVCWLPYLGAHVWMTTIRNVNYAEESMPYIMEFVVMFVALLNGLINPIVLMLSNRDYRKEIRHVCIHRFSVYSEDRSDSESMTMHSRRSQTISKTFQSVQDIHVASSEALHLKKQDSEVSNTDSCYSETFGQSDVLDICRLKMTVIANLQECKELMSQSCRNSVDLDPQLEHVTVTGQVCDPVPSRLPVIDHEDIKVDIDSPD